MWFWRTLAALVLMLAVVDSVRGADSLTIVTNFYSVTGSTSREIRRSIEEVRPSGFKPGTDALTAWQIQWRSSMMMANGQCRLTGIEVQTTVVITMPSWRPPTNAPPELVQRWVKYYQALMRHEQNHARSALLAAEAMRKQLPGLGPEASSAVLQSKIKTAADAIIAQHRKRDADYDQETDHGRKDGAALR